MLLTEEGVHAQVPRTPVERQKFIAAQEKSWMSLSWDRNKYTADQAKSTLILLSAIAFSDYKEPIDLSHLSDEPSSSREADSSGERGSSSQPEPQSRNQTQNQPTASGIGKIGKHGKRIKRPLDTTTGNGTGSKVKKRRQGPGKVPSNSIAAGTHVACLIKSAESEMWVLGRVEKYSPESKKYEVLDFDNDSEDQRYLVKRDNLRIIPRRAPHLDANKPVLAVYPKTTVFYKAHLVERKGKAWAVEFEDDYYDSNKIKEVDGRFILQDSGCVS